MTILIKNLMVEIVRRVSKKFQPQSIHGLVFHPPRTGMIKRLGKQVVGIKELF